MARRKDKDKDSRSQLVTYLKDSYWDRTSRPIYALVYLLGFLIFYELGTILINPEALSRSLTDLQGRVMAFVWVQEILALIGFSGRTLWIATPLVVVVILFAFQITSRMRWSVHFKDFVPMTFECILLAAPLVVLSLVINRTPGTPSPESTTAAMSTIRQVQILEAGDSVPSSIQSLQAASPGTQRKQVHPLFVEIVTGIGAGIYEELVFRLILICLLMLLFQDILRMDRSMAILLSVVLSALAFSIHHHVGFIAGQFDTLERFRWQPFIFRTLAGAYFAGLFALRGFGIAAGTHAFYDIIAAVLKYSVMGGE
ncbi:MAG: CPBP family intramembrane metalloprotease [Sedimentisphaerales bacterium]|nr:CPBP family intramembrane metalloprotease [Sedimentisphaerales bacterium]